MNKPSNTKSNTKHQANMRLMWVLIGVAALSFSLAILKFI